MGLSKVERKRVVRNAQNMGVHLHAHAFRRGFDRYIWTQGWGWVYINQYKRGESTVPFPTKYDAAMDFLKWALIYL